MKNFFFSLLVICSTFAAAQTTDYIETKENGLVNWTGQYIEATGKSFIDRERWTLPGQAEEMAKRGAVVVAQRNLLEVVQGVNVSGTTTVRDKITQGDLIITKVEGVVRGAQQVGKAKVTEHAVEVTLRMPIYAQNGLAPVVAASMGEQEQGQAVEPALKQMDDITDQITELGLNVTGNGTASPSMFPKFIDEDGRVLVDLAQLYKAQNGNFPAFAKMAQGGFDKKNLMDVSIDNLGNFVVSKIQRPKLKKFVNALFKVGGIALKILL